MEFVEAQGLHADFVGERSLGQDQFFPDFFELDVLVLEVLPAPLVYEGAFFDVFVVCDLVTFGTGSGMVGVNASAAL